MAGLLNRLLAHPLTRGLAVDDPRTTALRRQIIRGKPFLRALYREWYGRLLADVAPDARLLEIGSGAGFLHELAPGAITSEVFFTPGIDLVADGRKLPFPTASLDAIVMVDVFHHIPHIQSFLREAARCVRPGGIMAMIEPWRTPWSELVYRHLHPEPFEPDAGWDIPESGPLSGANGALPWIVFARDRARFEREHPLWRIRIIAPLMPFSYLLSGGVSMRSLAPGWIYSAARAVEKLGEPSLSMFAHIVLKRTP